MKKNHLAAALAAILILSSCSVFKKSSSKSYADGSTSVEVVQPDKNKIGKKKHNKTDKAHQMSEKFGKVPTVDYLTGGQWNIASVGGTNIVAEDNAPYIAFDGDGRFYAGDGCNVLNGDYVIRSDGKMSFSSVLSTMKMCPDMQYADLITTAISDGKVYSIDCERIGQDTYMTLSGADGKSAVVLRRHNMEFLNGNWQITSAEGKHITDEEANIFIDISELKVHGNTGCNYFNGAIYIDPSRSNAIDFSNMGLTRMACPKSEQERAIMVALEEAVSAIAGKNNDTVLLIDGKGKQLMTLKRIPMNKNE